MGKQKHGKEVRLHGGHATQKRLAAVLAWNTNIIGISHSYNRLMGCA